MNPSLNHVFGPVPSRRLGQSLGIDPVPLKSCNWNCIYCQLGRSTPMVSQRQLFYPVEMLVSQVREALQKHAHTPMDWITLVGSGETTLYTGIGELLREIKALTSLPVAVITNGSLLHLPEVRQALVGADAVLPSLDAGSPERYKQINRPHPSIPFERMVEGLTAFRREYHGQLWVEVMLVKGFNDSTGALQEIAAILQQVEPDQIHLLAPTRPPAESWVEPADTEVFLQAAGIFGSKAKIFHLTSEPFEVGDSDNLMESICAIITRHPMKESEIITALGRWKPAEVIEKLNRLEQDGTIESVERYGTRFWRGSPETHH